ncbi:FkbM family methyltransferase [bacterium]|nr:FkbM family methyltransferase [bacterium]
MYACFNNCDPKTNGELALVKSLPPNLIVFDIGTRADSEFTDYPGIVHYFEPMPEFIDKLSKLKTLNTTSYYNQFGLSDSTAILNYYPRYQSFHNRTVSCSVDDSKNVIKLNVKTANEYISEHKIIHIDFIKIDTEGHELHVLKGFGTYLNIVDRIQFEYGGTYKDTNTTLLEVITYLRAYGFTKFSYLSPSGNVPITDYSDHYKYCNILCER